MLQCVAPTHVFYIILVWNQFFIKNRSCDALCGSDDGDDDKTREGEGNN